MKNNIKSSWIALLAGFVVAGNSYTAGFNAAFPLSSLNGTNGFRIDGIDGSDRSGSSVSNAGDVNGDGVDDLIIGAFLADPGGNSSAGESYVVFGQSAGFSSALSLSALDGTNGFRIDGIDASDYCGYSVSAAGDVNGDNVGDMLIGAYLSDHGGISDAGESYVVFGQSGGFPASLSLSDLNGTNGFRLSGIDLGDHSGFSASGAGDMNGDGFGDLVIGAPFANGRVGESYVVFGQSGGFSASLSLSALNGTNGFRLDGTGGTAEDEIGFSVSDAGDVNGDGFDDVIIGSRATDEGNCYVVFGQSSTFPASLSLIALNGVNGFRLDGIDPYEYFGSSVSAAGDVNGDGVDDMIIGAYQADINGPNWDEGESYVVFGQSGGFPASLPVSSLNGANGFRLDGIDANDHSGHSVSGVGDVNGDGVADILIGARYADNYTGESYVVFGKTTGFSASMSLSAVNGTNGFRIDGIDSYDYCGSSVSAAGDVNGDGADDIIIGAWAADPGGNSVAGETYVVFGKTAGSDGGGDSSKGIENLTVVQRPGDKGVDIYYDLATNATVSLVISNGLASIDVYSVAGDAGSGVPAGISNHMVWIASWDWAGKVGDLTYTLIAENDSGTMIDQKQVQALTDTRDYIFEVLSTLGNPAPTIGEHYLSWMSTVGGSVEQTVSVDGTNYTCIGWHGTGSVPALGTSTNTGPITLSDVSSSIDWRWIADADSDRMSDDWELLYYGSTTGAVATADTDGDGYNAWQEYILGSNPTNGGSSFLFTPGTNPPPGEFSIDFTTVTGRLYTVECTDELGSGNWQVLTNFIGDGSAVQLIDPANIPACFYQIQIDWAE